MRLNKGYFLGRDALLQARAHVQRRLCCLTRRTRRRRAGQREPILVATACWVTSPGANYGYSVGKYILYGYLPHEYAAPQTKVGVQYPGVAYAATVTAEPLFDPKNERMKA